MEDELERRGVRSNGPAEDHNSSGDGRQWSISKPGSEAGSGGGDEAASSPWGTGGGGEPVLSPRGRGYLARLVVDVCKELDQSRKVRSGWWLFARSCGSRASDVKLSTPWKTVSVVEKCTA